MRFVFYLIFGLFSTGVYADYNSFPSPPASSPMPNNAYPPTPTATTGGDTFGSQVQQLTAQGMQVFQNVNYQKLSGAEDQGDFMSDSSSSDTSNSSNPSELFTIFQGKPQ